MKRIEELLREAPLRPSPPALDRRVRATLDAAAAGGGSGALLPIPLWACAAACVFCGFLGLGGGLLPRLPEGPGEPRAVVCYLAPSPGIDRLLRGGPVDEASSISGHTLTLRTEVTAAPDDPASAVPEAMDDERDPVQ